MPRLTLSKVGSDPDHSRLIVPASVDMSSAVADLAEDFLNDDAPSLQVAERGLQQLRRRARATDAVFWEIADGMAHRVLCAGHRANELPAEVEIGPDGMVIERLQRTGTIECRFGEVSGVEALVPGGVRSFVAAAATSTPAIAGVLVIAWSGAAPLWHGKNLRDLRIAAGLLSRMTTGARRAEEDSAITDAILGSLSGRIVVVDRDGVIVRVNAAWTEFVRQHDVLDPAAIGPGANYFDACRTAAANGTADAADIRRGVEAVCSGSTERFEAACRGGSPAREHGCTVTVTPLRHLNGGAVILHADVTPGHVVELSRRYAEERFNRLADTLPVALCMLTPGGTLLFGNQRWLQAAVANGSASSDWTTAFHADDRLRAATAFRSAVDRGEGFHIELRVNAADASTRWSECIGTPVHAANGELEAVVVVVHDISGKRRAESSLHRIAGRLVAAQESERSRIARELHDDLGQQVSLLASKLDLAGRAPWRHARSGLKDAIKGLHELATSVHNLSHELHPAKLKLLGLGLTLEALCRSLSAESHVPIVCDRTGIPRDVPEDAALCVFRVAQEALHNAVKHSAARNIGVHVAWTSPHLTLRITDDGWGFDLLASHSTGLGLLTMRERVELLGGKLTIDTSPGGGTMIEAVLPIACRDPVADDVTLPRRPGARRRGATRIDDPDPTA